MMPMLRRRYVRLLSLGCSLAAVSAIAIATVLPASSPAEKPSSQVLGHSALSGGLIVGLSAGAGGWGGSSTLPRLNLLTRRAGVKWMRDEFEWSVIEPRRGTFRWSYYDHYMLLVGQKGLHIVAHLTNAPRWASRSVFSIPADPTAYAQYVAAVVHRYGPSGTFWQQHPTLRGSAITTYELWNEPYYSTGNGGSYSPGRYARLLKAASIAAHAADPSVKILLDAEMQSEQIHGIWTWWVDSLYQAMPSLNRYFDGVAVHAFGTDTKTLRPVVYGVPYPNFQRLRKIEDIRHQMIRHGAAGKPFWIMETGFSTCTQRSSYCVSPRKQVQDFNALFHLLRTTWRSWVQAAFVYRYDDGVPSNSIEGGYGLVHLNGKAKPALSAVRSFASSSG
jgi:polysaccharide biosynthesis protein PslG